ncbi:MAG: MBL fold metallo-hydrolase [Clostridia bacterium]|nr:MBL fold metallo-hydrolase [Clostridia bacterium]
MEYQVIQTAPDTWRIEDGGVRLFLLAGTEKALLIDSGMNLRNARDIAESLTQLPVSLLNTHADRDHIGSNGQFPSFYMHPAEEPFYRSSGGKGTILPVLEGDTLDLGQRKLFIIHLPGHTPGSIAVLDESRRMLISGDPIQRNGHIFMFGPHRNMQDYIRGLEHLQDYADRFDEIWPSHGEIPVPKETVRLLADGARDILDGRVPGMEKEVFGNPVTVYDLGFCLILMKKEECGTRNEG